MIKDKVRKLLQELPDNVQLVAAAKTRTAQEIQEAIDAGVKLIGENYINPGSTLQLQMFLPEEIQGVRNYEFTATSKWCKKDEKPDFYNTGF